MAGVRREHGERPDSRRSWVVALTGAVAMIFTFGTVLSYGIFRDPFSETFEISSVALSGVFAIMLFAFFIGSGLVGVFGVRYSARAVLFVCTLATGLLAPSLYVTSSIVGVSVVLIVLGLILGTAYVLVASVVPRWFAAHRGAATGLIFAGNGLGLFVLPPVWQYAFAAWGVRRGFLAILSVTSVTFLATALVCRRPPWAEQTDATGSELLEWLRHMSGTRTFQMLFTGIALSFGWYLLLAAFAIDLFASRGMTQAGASAAFGLIGGVSIISRIGSGYLGDRFGVRITYLASFAAVAVGISLLFVPTIPTLAVAIFLTGLGLGGLASLYIPLLMTIYSAGKDTAIVGLFNIAPGVAALAMPPLGTASVVYTDGFTVALSLAFITVVIGILAVTKGTAAP